MLKLLISDRDDLEEVTGEKIRRREFVIVIVIVYVSNTFGIYLPISK